MASEAVWSHGDYAEWSDGVRRMTGPGIVFFDDTGRVLSVSGTGPPAASSEGENEAESGAVEERPQQEKTPVANAGVETADAPAPAQKEPEKGAFPATGG